MCFYSLNGSSTWQTCLCRCTVISARGIKPTQWFIFPKSPLINRRTIVIWRTGVNPSYLIFWNWPSRRNTVARHITDLPRKHCSTFGTFCVTLFPNTKQNITTIRCSSFLSILKLLPWSQTRTFVLDAIILPETAWCAWNLRTNKYGLVQNCFRNIGYF